jgi:hypothetical protein
MSRLGVGAEIMLTIVMGVLFVSAGLVVSAIAGIVETRAARGRQIILWRNSTGYRRPLASSLLLVAATTFVAVGAFFLLLDWGPAAILLLGLVFVPPFFVIAIHNKSDKASA